MIILRRGLYSSRMLVNCIRKNIYRCELLPCRMLSLQETPTSYAMNNLSYDQLKSKALSYEKNEKSSEESETDNPESEDESRSLLSEVYTFRNQKILELKTSADTKKFVKENIDSLTTNDLVEIFDKFHYFLVKEKWLDAKKLKLAESKEFHRLLDFLYKNISDTDVNGLIKILSFLRKMKLGYKSHLMQAIIHKIEQNVDQISFIKCAMLYYQFTREKVTERRKFSHELKIRIQNYILNDLGENNSYEILKAVYYASLIKFSVECNIRILNLILSNNTLWKQHSSFGNYLKILRKVPKNNPVHDELESKFYELLDVLKTNPHFFRNFCGFLFIYGNDVYFGDAEYRPKLIDEMIDGIMTQNMYIKAKVNCLNGLTVMKHVRHDFIKHVKDLIFSNEKILLNDCNYFSALSQALSNSHYCNVMPKEWPDIKKKIEGLEILNDTKKWKSLGLNHCLAAAVNLLSMGIYKHGFLSSLSEECNKNVEILEAQLGRLRLMLLINEALHVLHPKRNLKFLTEGKVLQFIKTTKVKTQASEERNNWLLQTKTNLETSVNQENCVLLKCRTKLGQEIDFVVAVDEDGNPFNFSQTNLEGSDRCIDNLNLPSKCKLILVFIVPQKEYNRNVPTLSASVTLKLKMLKTMGYRTLTIPHDEWTNLPDNEKSPYFWNLVKSKRNDLISNPPYEFIGNKIIEEVKKEGEEAQEDDLEDLLTKIYAKEEQARDCNNTGFFQYP